MGTNSLGEKTKLQENSQLGKESGGGGNRDGNVENSKGVCVGGGAGQQEGNTPNMWESLKMIFGKN